MTFLKKQKILLIVLCIGGFLRLYNLSSTPAAASLDEVSIGYNAYSILETGRDEYGTHFPIILRAYDDWRPAGFVYTVIPSVAVFGLNTFAVRFPSFVLSMVMLVVVYMTTTLIFDEVGKKHKKDNRWDESIIRLAAIAVTVLVAISPWHIYLSRLGHEVNLGLTLQSMGTLFFLRFALRDRPKDIVWSAISFALSFYGYQSQKLLVPIIVIAFSVLFLYSIKKHVRYVVFGLFIGLVISAPMIRGSLRPETLIRLEATTAFTPSDPQYEKDLQQFVIAKTSGDVLGQVMYNRRLTPIKIATSNYLSHFDPRWLIFGKAHESHKVPGLGLLYPWELIFLLIGLYGLFKYPIRRRLKAALLLPVMVSPLPAAITTQAPHAMRAVTAIPWIQILEGFGIMTFMAMALAFFSNKKTIRRNWHMFAKSMALVLLGSALYFSRQYFEVFRLTHSSSFQYALHEAMQMAADVQDSYSSVVVSNENELHQSYMFYLFETRYDPDQYLKRGGTISGGFAQTHEIGNISFRPVSTQEEIRDDTLYISNISDKPVGARVLQEFSHLEGEPVVVSWSKDI